MLVKDLIAELLKLPQDASIVKPGFDHSYMPLYGAGLTDAEQLSKGEWSEIGKCDAKGNPKPCFGGKIVQVVIID
jgi:hypothetical protein